MLAWIGAKPGRTLFWALLAALFLTPVLGTSPVARVIITALLSVVLLAALNLLADRRALLLVGLVLFASSLVLVWTASALGIPELFGAGRLVSLLFLALTVGAILQQILNARQVTTEVLYAAISAYLMIAVIGALAFSAMIVWQPAAIDFPVPLTREAPEAALSGDLVYFSLVTQTTLGYGDITPVSALARSVATLLAISGVLYLAVLVATLVGVYASQPRRPEA